ncbi:hypothetical protein CTAYLR_003196 [Chrysophaeum taylorii]|uniref:Cyclin n=1 Tax=Chrysophaeum taylorii TaxID=2483200 RepID=A0AAD7UC66_9STRA|nr:hypothetical protein CTAYLR_003196 [Chrysophaeum taylorii]
MKDEELIVVVSACLERLIGEDDSLTKFHSLRPPPISVLAYLTRIHKYANCSPACFVVSLVYIDRLCQESYITLSVLNIHRILITAICIAAKFHDDLYFPNGFYSQVGGIPLQELNSLEVEFLFGINFSLFVSHDTYAKYEHALLHL